MAPRALLLAALAALGALAGCTTTNGEAEPSEPELVGTPRSGASGKACAPKTCAQIGASCGSYDDGCGATLDCGACDPSCTKKTCAELGDTCGKKDDGCGGILDCGACDASCKPRACSDLDEDCGTHDDGCGGTVNCGACATSCPADSKESNDSYLQARDLGASTDSPTSSLSVSQLTLPDGDEDWFKTKVTDGGFNGNPRILAAVPRAMEVTVFYVCDSATNYSTCPNANDTPDNAIGHGCRGRASATLDTECSGIDESGTAYIRVRKFNSDGQCGGYSLDVTVE